MSKIGEVDLKEIERKRARNADRREKVTHDSEF